MRGRAGAAAGLLMVAAAVGVANTQPRLANTVHNVKEGLDVFALPPPDQLRRAILGWDAAAVDLLWAKLLVEYGTHFSEHREFTDIPLYFDAILALEPGYGPLYRYVDTMLAYRPLQGTEKDARLARAYLERGMRERPDDSNLLTRYGQFLAFIGPSFLTSESEKEAWRKDGAVAMGRAVELGADPERALSAASLLSRAGANREAIRYLESAYAFTEHPSMHEIHEAIGRRLESLQSIALRDAADAAAHAIDAQWQRELPVVSRDRYLLLGPVTDPARCTGRETREDAECARSWDEVIAPRESYADSP
jgi:hypothetical protein